MYIVPLRYEKTWRKKKVSTVSTSSESIIIHSQKPKGKKGQTFRPGVNTKFPFLVHTPLLCLIFSEMEADHLHFDLSIDFCHFQTLILIDLEQEERRGHHSITLYLIISTLEETLSDVSS